MSLEIVALAMERRNGIASAVGLKIPCCPTDKGSMFEWNTAYATEIGSIDAQHQTLFALGRELFTAMSSGQGKAVLARILDRLVQYTRVHFAHEERLMQLHQYPDFAAHKAQHDLLVKQVLAFQEEFNSGRATIAVQVLQFLKDWLENHIKHSDMSYIACMKANKAA